jgi:hypothetical protein
MHRLAAFGCLQFFALWAAKLKSHPVLPGEIATASSVIPYRIRKYVFICAGLGVHGEIIDKFPIFL